MTMEKTKIFHRAYPQRKRKARPLKAKKYKIKYQTDQRRKHRRRQENMKKYEKRFAYLRTESQRDYTKETQTRAFWIQEPHVSLEKEDKSPTVCRDRCEAPQRANEKQQQRIL